MRNMRDDMLWVRTRFVLTKATAFLSMESALTQHVVVLVRGACCNKWWLLQILYTDSALRALHSAYWFTDPQWNVQCAKKMIEEDFMRRETCVGVYLSVHLAGLTLTSNRSEKKKKIKSTTYFLLGLRGSLASHVYVTSGANSRLRCSMI